MALLVCSKKMKRLNPHRGNIPTLTGTRLDHSLFILGLEARGKDMDAYGDGRAGGPSGHGEEGGGRADGRRVRRRGDHQNHHLRTLFSASKRRQSLLGTESRG
jgi:hypothetical protein